MKLYLLAAFLALPLAAQTTLPETYVTAGLFYNTYNKPAVSGYGAFAKKIGEKTYSWSAIDVTSRSSVKFDPQTTTSTGIAQYVYSFADMNIFAIATAGVTTAGGLKNTGADLGFSGSGGFLLVKPIKGSWTLNIPVRILASTIGPPQYVLGLGLGFGK